MNKKLIFSLLAVIMLVLTACKKDYNCRCEWYVEGNLVESQNFEIENVSKEDAAYNCHKKENSYTGEYSGSVKGNCQTSQK